MSGLAFASAPRPSLPMRFLVAALAWGAVAGLWLAWQGEIALLSRWTPATLVLVHVFALGLLGNAMLGSLVQFLPVAAGSPLPGTRVVPWLHAAFNAGLALLLATLAASSHALALPAGGLLDGSLAIFALLALVAVIRGKGARVVREGIGLALLALIVTAALGLLLLAARTGWRGPAAAGMVDVHAAFGVIGWVLGLLAAVGGVTLPMLQGTRALPAAPGASRRGRRPRSPSPYACCRRAHRIVAIRSCAASGRPAVRACSPPACSRCDPTCRWCRSASWCWGSACRCWSLAWRWRSRPSSPGSRCASAYRAASVCPAWAACSRKRTGGAPSSCMPSRAHGWWRPHSRRPSPAAPAWRSRSPMR